MRDPYETLGVPRDASKSDIKHAYKRKAREHHPDRGGDKVAFQDVNAAQQLLLDDARRAKYDATGNTEPVQDEHAQILTALARLVLRFIDQAESVAHVDIVAQLRRALHQTIQQLNQQRAERESAIAKREEALRRLRRKDGGDNGIIGSLIKAEIEKLRAGIKMGEAECERVARILDVLKEYEYQVDDDRGDRWPRDRVWPGIFGQSGQ